MRADARGEAGLERNQEGLLEGRDVLLQRSRRGRPRLPGGAPPPRTPRAPQDRRAGCRPGAASRAAGRARRRRADRPAAPGASRGRRRRSRRSRRSTRPPPPRPRHRPDVGRRGEEIGLLRVRDAPERRLEADDAAAGRGEADGAAAVGAERERSLAASRPRRRRRRRSRPRCARDPTGCGWRRRAGCRSAACGRTRAWWSCRRGSAPASRSRRTGTASSPGTWSAKITEPMVVRTPLVNSRSLTENGTPWSGPSRSPAITAVSAAARRVPRLVRGHGDERVHRRLEGLDPTEHRVHRLDGRDLLGADLAGEGQRVGPMNVARRHRGARSVSSTAANVSVRPSSSASPMGVERQPRPVIDISTPRSMSPRISRCRRASSSGVVRVLR